MDYDVGAEGLKEREEGRARGYVDDVVGDGGEGGAWWGDVED